VTAIARRQLQDRHRRARPPRRHLPQLGLHPDQGALALGRDFPYQHAKDYGLSAGNVGFDAKAVVARRARCRSASTTASFLMKKNKVQVIWGEAAIEAVGKVAVKPSRQPGQGRARARQLQASTSSSQPVRTRVSAGAGTNKTLVWTFRAMMPERMPKSLLVVGSGAIGVEFASFYRTFGADITVVEVLPQILPVEDAEIAAFAREAFGSRASRSSPAPRSQARPQGRRRHRH
jgi:dihydrolipoamide dehydrogenase